MFMVIGGSDFDIIACYIPLMLFHPFYYNYANHSIIHSFPTRRSSDLYNGARFFGITAPMTDVGKRIDDMDRVGIDVEVISRSEEHTSELQSHSDIVCRLLLEKKNEIRIV